MNFSDKLQLVRKSRGMIQDELAEALGVSRQAVAKWESGQSYPDIANLIALSDIFRTTVDRLVRDEDCGTSAVRAVSTDIERLSELLVRAKIKTYAGKGMESPSSRPCSHDLQYREGDYLYIDSYLGGELFSGEEAVWIKEVPVFAMNYSGRVTDDDFSGDFLKAALSAVETNEPYRGPRTYSEGDYTYCCRTDGAPEWFQGYEEIYFRGKKVYECFFNGGAVK